MATIAAKLGLAKRYERPECDQRTAFWINTYHLATRSRPHTHGIHLQLDPLKIIALIDALELPADPEEAVVVVCAMDDAWLAWKNGQKSSKTKAA